MYEPLSWAPPASGTMVLPPSVLLEHGRWDAGARATMRRPDREGARPGPEGRGALDPTGELRQLALRMHA